MYFQATFSDERRPKLIFRLEQSSSCSHSRESRTSFYRSNLSTEYNRRGDGPGVQPNERVRIPQGERQPRCRPVHRGRPAHTQRMAQLLGVHPRTVRPTERSHRAQNTDTKSRGTRDNAVRLRHVEPGRVPLRHAVPSPPQVLDSLHRLAKAQSRRPLDFLFGHAYQDGK